MPKESLETTLALLKQEIEGIRRDVDELQSNRKWAILLILGIVITAVINVVVKLPGK